MKRLSILLCALFAVTFISCKQSHPIKIQSVIDETRYLVTWTTWQDIRDPGTSYSKHTDHYLVTDSKQDAKDQIQKLTGLKSIGIVITDIQFAKITPQDIKYMR